MTDTQREIMLKLARSSAAAATKYPGNKQKILLGKWDDRAPVIRAMRRIEREILLASAEGIHPLRDEEDEPCFAPLIERAKARAAELAGTPDGDMIAGLVAAYEHSENMADMIYWNASDNHELPHDA